jgi:hypothetical protein
VSPRLPILVAIGVSLGVIGAYLLAGGASYQPLEVADPCEERPVSVLAERGVLEGIVLSGLDGAACELGVSREELTLALADDEALATFAEARGISEEQVTDAVRAGLRRAVDDAEAEGVLSTPVASVVRAAVEVVPVGPLLDAFRSIPGEPTVPQIIEALSDADLSLERLDEALDGLGSDLEAGFEALRSLLDPGAAP